MSGVWGGLLSGARAPAHITPPSAGECVVREWSPDLKVARNLMRSLFEIACKRCNSNDGNSACEAVVGELRAKLLRLVTVVVRVALSSAR